MVFVLFLTSLAVIEYLLQRERAAPKKGPEINPADHRQANLRQTDPGSLLSLADAIDRQGRGSPFSTGEVPAEHRNPADKVTETPR